MKLKTIYLIRLMILLAHCVSSDLKMGKGLAKQILNKYENIRSLIPNTIFNIGDSIVTHHTDRTIFHLVTKKLYFDKPQHNDIQVALHNLMLQAQKNNIFKIAFSKIASGLDLCKWEIIRKLIY